MDIQHIVHSRLTQLGCDKLPKPVRDAILASFTGFMELQCKKHAQRQITIPKIAKLFAEHLKQKQMGEGDYLNLPLQDEAFDIAGTLPPPLDFIP